MNKAEPEVVKKAESAYVSLPKGSYVSKKAYARVHGMYKNGLAANTALVSENKTLKLLCEKRHQTAEIAHEDCRKASAKILSMDIKIRELLGKLLTVKFWLCLSGVLVITFAILYFTK